MLAISYMHVLDLGKLEVESGRAGNSKETPGFGGILGGQHTVGFVLTRRRGPF